MDRNEVVEKLCGMIGEPYEEPQGCLKFAKKALREFGIEIQGSL